MRMVFICKQEETPEEGFQLFRYMFINAIFQFIEKFKADEVIIALDSRKNWRKQFFKYYKADRKFKRQTEDDSEGWFTYQQFYDEFDRLINDIQNNLPFKTIKIDNTEADDIAGVLCSSEALSENIKIVITNDKDYNQMLAFPMVKVFNPMTKEFVKCEDPKKELIFKIIMGDKGDYVPSIQDRHIFKEEFLEYCVKEDIAQNTTNVKIKLEGDEELKYDMELKFQEKYGIKPSRVMRFSSKLANSLSKDRKELNAYLAEDEELKKKFVRNNRLVNLSAQPPKIKELILQTYNNYELKAGLNKLFEFFILNSFNQFMEETTKIGKLLQPLCIINKGKADQEHNGTSKIKQTSRNI